MKWTLERPCFAEPTEITSPVWHYNLPSQNQQAARSSHALSKGLSCQKWKQEKNVGLKKHWAQLTDLCHGFQSQKVPARTGAKRSRMDTTAGNELAVYMEMMKAEKERFKMKICLIDKWFVVPFLPLFLALVCSPGQPHCVGTMLCMGRRDVEWVRKQGNCLVSSTRATSFTDITGQKGFQV